MRFDLGLLRGSQSLPSGILSVDWSGMGHVLSSEPIIVKKRRLQDNVLSKSLGPLVY